MFVRGANPIWYFVNLVGIQLDDTYYAFFLTNTLPYLPQNVYMDNQGQTVWTGDILQFLPNGTLPDNLYFDPTLVYRIEIRQGPTQNDPLIYEINNYVPCCSDSGGGGGGSSGQFVNAQNQITNSQFSTINFVSPFTITVAGTYNIAPGWQLVLTGIGSTTITQLVFHGTDQIPNNPPFALRFNNAGWTTAYLIQTFSNNGSIWNGGGVSMSFLAESQIVPQTISMSYVPSDSGTPIIVINNAVLTVGVFQTFAATVAIPSPSTNSDPSSVAYVQAFINLPPTGIVDITNIQVVGQSAPLTLPFAIPPYQQQTSEEQSNGLFYYYEPSIILQPKSSILTGWNFGLNPWQFTATTPANVAGNQYTADQTIVIQQNYVATATGNNIAVGRATFSNNLGFLATAVTAHNQFGILQYIDPSIIAPYWGNILSSLVTAYFNSAQSPITSIKLKMRLIYNTALPSSLSQTYPVVSWTEGGDPVFAAGWTALTPLNDPAYPIGGGTNNLPTQFSFNGFKLPLATTYTMTLGIFLYTVGDMNQASPSDFLVINDVSLVPNSFAIASNPITFEETLKQCEFYYEQSYAIGNIAGSIISTNSQFAEMFPTINGGAPAFVLRGFEVSYRNLKRSIPSVNFYSPTTGASNTVDYDIRANGLPVTSGQLTVSTNWGALSPSTQGSKSSIYIPTNAAITTGIGTTTTFTESFLLYHYTADSRM